MALMTELSPSDLVWETMCFIIHPERSLSDDFLLKLCTCIQSMAIKTSC